MFHMFDTEIATRYGVNAAVLFQNIAFWCSHSRANGTNFHDGLYWTYNSVKAFQELFPYLGKSQISSALQKLLDEGLIVKGNYNKVAYDRTAWYAVTELGDTMFRKPNFPFTENQQMDFAKSGNGNTKNRKPIPDINSDVNPDNNNGAKAQRFTPPTLEQLQAYISEKGYTSDEIDPEYFIDHYTSNGWICGKSKMKDWQATVNNWVRRYRKEHPAPKQEPEKPHSLYSENLSPEELMRRQKEQAEKDREEARRQGLL